MSSLQDEIDKLETELGDVLARTRACVLQLRSTASSDLQFLIAERLPALGSAALPAIREILEDSKSSESVRYLGAWVAIEIGDRRAGVVSILCAEVAAGTKWSLPAAGVLARHGMRDGAPAVASALERSDPQNTVELMGYATALRALGGQLSQSVRQRVQAESPKWLAGVINDDFPE